MGKFTDAANAASAERNQVVLSDDDPFESAIIDMVLTNRRKRKDYALDGDPFSNFHDTSELMGLEGFSAVESALFNVLQKIVRLKSLRANGRMDDTANEAVDDTYLDLAVYAVIVLALSREPVVADSAGPASGFAVADFPRVVVNEPIRARTNIDVIHEVADRYSGRSAG